MNDEPHDPVDDALRSGLADLGRAARVDDADAVLGALRPRLQRARSRHRIAQVSVVVAGVLVVGSAAAALSSQGSRRSHVSVVVSPTTGPDGRTGPPATQPTTTTIGPAVTPGSLQTTTTARSTPVTPVTPVPAANPRPATPRSTTVPVTAPPASEVQTFGAPGGTIRVRFAEGSLALVSFSAARGYTAEVHDDRPDRVEVRFLGSPESRIRVRVENGGLVSETE